MILDAAREAQFNQNKFLAALKGINLEEGAAEDKVAKIKERLAAQQAGMTEEEYDLTNAGLGFEYDEEE